MLMIYDELGRLQHNQSLDLCGPAQSCANPLRKPQISAQICANRARGSSELPVRSVFLSRAGQWVLVEQRKLVVAA